MVIQTYALSKLWYIAQVLPLPASMNRKIEALVSSFIFQGRHERLKLSEIQNPEKKGGLGLTCVATKAECLLLRQCLRVLDKPNLAASRHLGHWLGNFLRDAFPDLGVQSVLCQKLPPRFPHHSVLLESLEEGLIRLDFKPDDLGSVTTKAIYQKRAEDVIPPPKVETEFPEVDFGATVFPRLCHPVLEPAAKDVVFCVSHGLFRNRARLFRQHRAQDPFCQVPECQGKIQDREHIFCSCSLVAEAWLWVRRKLLQLLPTTIGAAGISNEDFIMMHFPKDLLETECVWLLGNYMEVVETVVVGTRKNLRKDYLRGVLSDCLLVMRERAVLRPNLLL